MKASLQPLYNTVCLEVITEQKESALRSSVSNSLQQSFPIKKMEVQGSIPPFAPILALIVYPQSDEKRKVPPK